MEEIRSRSGRFHKVFASVLLLGAGLSSAPAVDILSNGNLDAVSVSTQVNPSPTGWVLEATKSNSGEFTDGANSEPWCNVRDTGGYGVFFKPFQGNVDSGDLLSVFLYQDNPATVGSKFTLSGFAAAESRYSGLESTNDPAPQTLFMVLFLDASGAVISSNSLDLIAAGLPTGGPNSMAEFSMPEVVAPPNTATVRAGVAMLNVYSTSGQQSFFADAFTLDATLSAGAPVIDVHPEDATVAPGGSATFTVRLSNPSGIRYQWQHARTNLTDGGNIAGATTSTLTVSNASEADIGKYRVLVTNDSGSIFSNEANLATVGIEFSPVIQLVGKIGDNYRIDYATSVAPTTWIPLSTNKLVSSPQALVDSHWRESQARFYRAVYLP
ncbi:MAG: immunoglobulin domain-containing protein [Verrucomicrobiales bacterium]|nr:immunoglobulin domain-containing protein [Verrucomicrobiales bacterium]